MASNVQNLRVSPKGLGDLEPLIDLVGFVALEIGVKTLVPAMNHALEG